MSGPPLRIAYLVYRGKPHVGGQGVYTRHLTRALVELGHHVEVFAGPPYPVLDERVPLHKLENLDLYREPDPFRVPKLREFKDRYDWLEFALMCTAAFPEPYTFSLRAARALKDRLDDFDLVHDNQCLGSGLLKIMDMGLPVLGTIHHPITVDRRIEIENAPNWRRRMTFRRWYAFTKMQSRVAQRLERIITVSESSHGDIVKDHGVDPTKLHVVNVGVDPKQFRPLPDVARVPGRLMCTSSSDVPMKGVIYLMEAVAKIRTERPDVHVTVIGKPNPDGPVMQTIRRLDLERVIEFVYGVSDERIVELYAEAELAVVPSLYEGFSLPAVEAMAAGVPLVATTGGAVGEVVGRDGTTAALVPPGDAGALATTILELMGDPDRRAAIGAAGRARVLSSYSWEATAANTVEQYRALLAETRVPRAARADV
ncbi:MAG TPA: glycosyltransferase family 4 protein [Acidimicrobiales bacterium]|nr:glycosyltransferase family 4 protein [Acidimicrobiales bacterium]